RGHSILRLARCRPAATRRHVVVSTAAGAVGSAVAQIAKLMGCRTVGLTGGSIKCKLCREDFGYDDVIDYKHGALGDALARACPRGVDVYFDNTAGAIAMRCYRSSPLARELSSAVPPRWQVGLLRRLDRGSSAIFS